MQMIMKSNYQILLANYRQTREDIQNKMNDIFYLMFAEYLNNEFKLSEKKDQLLFVKPFKNNLGYYNFPWELANQIHQWIYDNKIELKHFDFNGVVVDILDNHYASVTINFNNQEAFDKFQINFNVESKK